MTDTAAPDALLLLSTHCPHCPTVLAGLAELVKQGTIGRLEVVNLEQHPEVARQYGVRSVPWVRIGPLQLTGLHSQAELAEWARKAASPEGLRDWIVERMTGGDVQAVVDAVRRDPAVLDAVIDLLADPDAEITARIGIGVVMEELEGSELLRSRIDRLGELTRHEHPAVRTDACHYLSLSHDPAARPWLERCLQDADPGVREVAEEGLAALAEGD